MKTTEIEIEVGHQRLSGSLLEPLAHPAEVIALIIAGSGPTDRDGNNEQMINNSLRFLAEALCQQGIASLRYDKRGIGKSSSTAEHQVRFGDYIEDARAWIDELERRERFKEIVVIGHSEGALIGSIVSRSSAVSKFVSLAGVGRPIHEVITQQLNNHSSELAKQAKPILDSLVLGKLVECVPPDLQLVFRPTVQPYLISWFKHNPSDEIAKLEVPVLLVQGTTDLQVSVEDAEHLHKAQPSANKVIIEGMNHILKNAPLERESNLSTYYDPQLPLNDRLNRVLVEFMT